MLRGVKDKSAFFLLLLNVSGSDDEVNINRADHCPHNNHGNCVKASQTAHHCLTDTCTVWAARWLNLLSDYSYIHLLLN